ncbi:DUF2218 domain-containing protein [Phenylobacterium sp.]|jgi:hypothetical protein|uniref:DUF2218 domain-containing protein n=1 Tax=Phenylobacterium sp. TaxID=1871053 RepID=UPI002F944B0A
MNDHSAAAAVPTKSASRYLQQLCKHWSHNFTVEFTPTEGKITFPRDARGRSFPADGTVTLEALENGLAVRVDASASEQLDGIKAAVASHLDRFAFREAPLAFDWR